MMKPDTHQLRSDLKYWAALYPQIVGYDAWPRLENALAWIDKTPEPSLDGPPIQGKKDTSKLAAKKIEPHVGTARHRILEEFRNYAFDVDEYGFTDSELMKRTDYLQNTLRPRRNELVEMGFLEDTGHKRKNPRGNLEIIWGLSETAQC
jgi:hypothetical protein